MLLLSRFWKNQGLSVSTQEKWYDTLCISPRLRPSPGHLPDSHRVAIFHAQPISRLHIIGEGAPLALQVNQVYFWAILSPEADLFLGGETFRSGWLDSGATAEISENDILVQVSESKVRRAWTEGLELGVRSHEHL